MGSSCLKENNKNNVEDVERDGATARTKGSSGRMAVVGAVEIEKSDMEMGWPATGLLFCSFCRLSVASCSRAFGG